MNLLKDGDEIVFRGVAKTSEVHCMTAGGFENLTVREINPFFE